MKQRKYSWRPHIAILFLMFALPGCSGFFLSEQPNTVGFLKRYYGADDRAIEVLAQQYGVAVTDIPKFGPYPFPVNFIRSQIGWSNEPNEQPPVYRKQIEALVKGYVAECRVADTIVL